MLERFSISVFPTKIFKIGFSININTFFYEHYLFLNTFIFMKSIFLKKWTTFNFYITNIAKAWSFAPNLKWMKNINILIFPVYISFSVHLYSLASFQCTQTNMFNLCQQSWLIFCSEESCQNGPLKQQMAQFIYDSAKKTISRMFVGQELLWNRECLKDLLHCLLFIVCVLHSCPEARIKIKEVEGEWKNDALACILKLSSQLYPSMYCHLP